MNCDVGSRGDASLGHGLEDDGGVQPGEPRPAVVGRGHHGTEAEARRVADRLDGKDALKWV